MAQDDDSGRSLGELTSALSRALRLSHFTIERAPEFVFWLADDGRTTRVNRAVVAVLGAQETVVGKPLSAFLDDSGAAAFRGCLSDVRASGKPGTVELSLRDADGHLLLLDVILAPVDVDETRYYCVFGRDVTERKRTERALSEALQELRILKEHLEDENRDLKRELSEGAMGEEFVGESPALRQAVQRAEQVARSDASVLILGESGSGKELIARAVHRSSRRAEQPLVKVNCASLPESLIESELFGHEKGAFTHAVSRRLGRFELADGGTLFLDEVGELPLTLQPKLLRVLQEGEFERVGGDRTIKVDVRLVAATNRELAAEVAAGRFRADLYYRLSVVPLHVPPLRERREDIPLLAQHFVRNFSARAAKPVPVLSKGMVSAMGDYDWPGNVRELSNVVERAVTLHRGGPLELDAPLRRSHGTPTGASGDEPLPTLREMEERLIRRALSQTAGVVGGRRGAARLLDMADSTLRERLQRYGIDPADFQHTRDGLRS